MQFLSNLHKCRVYKHSSYEELVRWSLAEISLMAVRLFWLNPKKFGCVKVFRIEGKETPFHYIVSF